MSSPADSTPATARAKGEFHGNCNRTACDQPDATYFNQSTRRYYCEFCARTINRVNFDDAFRLHNGQLCVPPDHPKHPHHAAPAQAPTPGCTMWVHDLDAGRRQVGSVFGWRSDDSPTGWLSGIIVEADWRHLRVKVRDVQLGMFA